MFIRSCALLMLFCVSGWAHAVEYVSVSTQSAVLYDAPSAQATKLGTVTGAMPYEVVVTISGWVKVRDAFGKLYWLAAHQVSTKRYVLVMQRMIDVFDSPQFSGLVLFRASQDVVLEWLETIDTGWVKVRHQDGEVGFVRSEGVWGG
jgi:SH3-like domain-containing protein